MKSFTALCAAAVALLSTEFASPESARAAVEMKPIAKFDDQAADFKIINGTRAIPREWPGTFVFSDASGSGCTSTAIGPRVILTAAHCIPDRATGTIEMPSGSITQIECERHPGYHDDVADDDPLWVQKGSPDFALCAASSDITDTIFETIDVSGAALKVDRPIHLLGFGCNAEGGSDGGFGVLYEGDALLRSVPMPPSYYLVTTGGAAVCFGDSGGDAYVFLNQDGKRRLLVGVNSRGNIADTSYLSSTSVSGFLKWAKKFATDRGVTICGLPPGATGCRQTQ